MSTYFTSDPHLGHKNIAVFRDYVEGPIHNTHIFMEDYYNTIRKRDLVFFLGDVAFDEESLLGLRKVWGRKILIKGNHDDHIPTKLQMEVFEEIHGMISYKGFWLTHCPIHPVELRGRTGNIHGHVHSNTLDDDRYLNVCVDNIKRINGNSLISLEEVRWIFEQRTIEKQTV